MILHLDIDSFFASVEESIRPELVGREVIVAHPEGMVLAANYMAKAKGVRTTDLASISLKKLVKPSLLPVRYWSYSLASANFFEILENIFKPYNVEIEQISIDECFIKSNNLITIDELEYIKDELFRLTKLPVSIGAGESKLIAKQASKKAKPFGVLLIRKGEGIDFLKSFPLEKLWGFGPKTCEKLKNYGIDNLSDLLEYKNNKVSGLDILALKNHLYDCTVGGNSKSKSISVERSIRPGSLETMEIKNIFEDSLNSLAYRIQKSGLGYKNLELKITLSDGEVAIYRHKESAHTLNINLLSYHFRLGYENLSREFPVKQIVKITLGVSSLAQANNVELFSDYPIYEITPPVYTLTDVAYYGLPVTHKYYGKGYLVSISSESLIIRFKDRDRIIIDESSLLYAVD